jgi:hypothetical protein
MDPGFTVTTEACNGFRTTGSFPAGMWNQALDAMKKTEKATGKKFGDATNPLLVSCRSGAKFSMPGMMNTILNIGLNDRVVEGMIALTKSLALTMGKYGVTVNGLNPGMTDTPLARAAIAQWQDKLHLDVLGRCSEPGEIAGTVLFLAGTAGSFMTGQIIGIRMRHGA